MRPFLLVLSAIVMVACQSPKEKLEGRISALEKSDSSFNQQTLAELSSAYLEFSEKYPDDDRAPEYLFKAAQRYNVMNRPAESIALFDKLINKYPSSPLCREAAFLKGFTYENSLQDYGKAAEAYKAYIAKYPESELADDARIALDNLGKSPEEILEAARNGGQGN